MITTMTAEKGVKPKPFGAVIYALSGLGKTTLLGDVVRSSKNGILFQCGEDALSDLNKEWADSVPHYPLVLGDHYDLKTGEDDSNWSDMQRAAAGYEWFRDEFMKFLMIGKHEFVHLAFDSFDNIVNRNMDAWVTLKHYNGSESKANGYGGAKLCEMYTELTKIVKMFEYLQKRGMSIYISCHSQTITFKDPANPDYKKWTLALPAKENYNLRTLLINWSSATMFGTKEVDVDKKKASGGKHILMTKDDPSYEAKCRYDIPEQIDFKYDALKAAITKALTKGEKS